MAMIWRGREALALIRKDARRKVRDACILTEKAIKVSMKKGGRTASGGRGEGEKLEKVGTYVSAPGEPPRVQTNRLRANYTHEMHPVLPIGRAGTNVEYACIHGSARAVVKGRGGIQISQLKPGDLVLTQDGGYHPIQFTKGFPATEKPNLVELTVEWRSDKDHRLILTDDHKVLVIRNGANCWVQAGMLRVGDTVFSPGKLAHNKGKRVRVALTCHNCGKAIEKIHSRVDTCIRHFCSLACSAKWRPIYHRGKKRSAKSRHKMSVSATRRMKEHPEQHPNRILAKRGHKTRPEREIEAFLNRVGWEYSPQFNVGRHFVDFAVPAKRLLIEADGAYWHQDQAVDVARDKELKEELPGWGILHIHFTEARFSKDIDPNPIKGVRYIQCNDSMGSYVDDRFQQKSIKAIRRWRFDNKGFVGGNKPIILYDVGVEDVHSLVVNGMIVSNSHLEFGTRRMAARPHVRPVLHALRGAYRAIFGVKTKGM